MLVLGSQSKFLDVDLSVCGGTYSFSNSLIKEGAVPCKHLCASSSLEGIRYTSLSRVWMVGL